MRGGPALGKSRQKGPEQPGLSRGGVGASRNL